MKKIKLLLVLCLLMGAVFVNDIRAQEAEQSNMFLLMEEFVAPSDLAQFWAAQDEALEKMDELEMKITFYAYQTDDNSFYWAIPIKNFAGIDDFFAGMWNANKLLMENGYDSKAKFRDLSNISLSVVALNPALGYKPAQMEDTGESRNFNEWAFVYLKSGHEKEAAEVMQQFIDFYKKENINYEWEVYEVVFGEHTPCWIIESQAANEAALRKQELELHEKYGKDFEKMWMDFVSHVRTIETKKGWFLSQWSRSGE